MITFVGHLEVEADPDDVFDRLADMAVLESWNPNVASSRRVHGGRLEPGSRYESVIARGPMRLKAHSTLTEVELGRRVRYEGSIGVFWSVDELSFEPTGRGCRITFRNDTSVPVWLRPVSPLLNAAFQPQARKAVLGAERHLLGGD